MPKYKYGKQTETIDFTTFQNAMENGHFSQGNYHRSFLAFLYWFGVRRSEALERTPENFEVKDNVLIVNAPAKKEGERPPLELSLELPYSNLILQQVAHTREGLRVWAFSERTAVRIVKRAMGDKYYPHFFRLNRATRFLDDPSTTIPEMKAWFGWKTTKTVDDYIGYSKRYIQKQRKRLEREVE